jgi:hypothetical protein
MENKLYFFLVQLKQIFFSLCIMCEIKKVNIKNLIFKTLRSENFCCV